MSPEAPHLADETELLRIYLADRDVSCPQCKYNLRNLVGSKCPECGETLQLRVSPVEPRQAAPLTGLVLLSAGVGLNALLLIYALIQAFIIGRGRGLGKFVAVNAIEFAVMGAGVAMWLVGWQRIRRLDALWRWLLVAGTAALTLADVIVFANLIR